MEWKEFFNGLLVLVVGVLGWVASRKGWKDAGKPVGIADLPAAPLTGRNVTTTTFTDDADIIAIKQLTGEITGLAYSNVEQTDSIKKLAGAVDKSGERLEKVLEETNRSLIEVRDEMRELRGEMRAGRRN